MIDPFENVVSCAAAFTRERQAGSSALSAPSWPIISVTTSRGSPPSASEADRAAARRGVEARLRSVKVAYIFSTSGHTASYKLGKMILPQLEQGNHGVEVVGMFFFDDNTYVLRAGDPLGERLAEVAEEQGIMLMLCDRCAIERSLAEGEPGDCRPSGTVAGVRVGCFPDLYGALSGNPPDQVITL